MGGGHEAHSSLVAMRGTEAAAMAKVPGECLLIREGSGWLCGGGVVVAAT